MTEKTLKPELFSLIHHIELNRAGWWEKAIQRFIITSIWLLDTQKGMEEGEILACLKEHFAVSLDVEKLHIQLSQLIASGTIVTLPDGRYKVSESSLLEFSNELKEAERITNEAQSEFRLIIEELCPTLDPQEVWEKFNENFVIPLVKETGANTYQLISGNNENTVEDSKFTKFLNCFPPSFHQNLYSTASNFLYSKNPYVRSYILRLLNTFFFVEAGSLNADTLEKLSSTSTEQIEFSIFIDTNFLFLMMGLDDNPSSSTVLSLSQLIKNINGKINLRQIVLPQTIDEAILVLKSKEDLYGGSTITPNLATSAMKVDAGGLTRKFLLEAKKTKGGLSARDYFSTYRKNIVEIIKSEGIEIFNQDLTSYNMRQDVVDDILAQQEFEKKKYGDRAKNYERLKHDVILWHVVNDQRPKKVDNPLYAKVWVVTIDYRHLGFDAYKNQNLPASIPVCIHPATLIQTLQFWVPRTPQFEEVMFNSLRLPFLCQEFDSTTEQVTIKIIQTLCRFENIGDLPEPTVTGILLNEALRQKLDAESDISTQVELVKEAIIAENNKTQQQLLEISTKANRLTEDLENKESTLRTLQEKLIETNILLEQERSERKNLSESISKLNERSEKEEKDKIKSGMIHSFLWVKIILPISGIFLFAFLLFIMFPANYKWVSGAILGIGVIIWTWVTDKKGIQDVYVRDWHVFKAFHKTGKWLVSIFGVLILSLLSNAVYDVLKQFVLTYFKK
jgi:uncharacterized membrane protein